MHPLHPGFTPDFDRDKYLYHYTSVDTAINYILHNKTLRLNTLANVNDPMESDPSRWSFSNYGNGEDYESIREKLSDYFKNKTKVVCFSGDDQSEWESPEFNPLDYCARGHSKPRMWATYGDDHQGVCIVYDKELLAKGFERELSPGDRLFHGSVRYGKKLPAKEREAAVFDLSTFRENFQDSLCQKIEDFYDMYFFYKHLDWSTENEYRFVVTGDSDGPIELPFFDALAGVVVGTKCKHGFMDAIGTFTQEMNIPCVYLDWGWNGAGRAPVNKAATKLGSKY